MINRVDQHDDETEERHEKRDASGISIGDRSLNRRENGATGDAHDHQTGASTGVSAEIRRAHHENRCEHQRFEEKNRDENDHGGAAVTGGCVSGESDADQRVNAENKICFEKMGQTRTDETTDGERNQGVGEKIRGLRIGEIRVFARIIDEERTDRYLKGFYSNEWKWPQHIYLCAHVAELGDESEDQIVLFPERLNVRIRFGRRCFHGGLRSFG